MCDMHKHATSWGTTACLQKRCMLLFFLFDSEDKTISTHKDSSKASITINRQESDIMSDITGHFDAEDLRLGVLHNHSLSQRA